jgi:hypothetical protein
MNVENGKTKALLLEGAKEEDMKDMNKKSGWTISVSLFMSLLMLSGCSTVGPDFYKSSFEDFNDAIRKTSDGQMLSNLVRMRYLETPVFLQVASITTSFNINGNIGASAGFPEGEGNNYGLSAGAGFSESPTISFSLPESDKYYGRLLAPLSAKQITSLYFGGFDSEAVFLTTARGVNRLRNISPAFGNTATETASFSDFKEVFALITKLRGEGLVDIELTVKQADWSSPVTIDDSNPISKVLLLGAVTYANANNFELVNYDNDVWQTHRYEQQMSLRFAPASKNSPDAQRLRELLNLEDDRYNFPMVNAEVVNAEKPRGIYGQAPGALDPNITWAEIGLRGRSMMEIMQVASKKVQMPEEEVARGVAVVDANQGAARDTGLVIKSSKSEPDSMLRTNYRGYWFYIDDRDLESRKQFALLNALFAVIGGTVPGANPIMTIPVGL